MIDKLGYKSIPTAVTHATGRTAAEVLLIVLVFFSLTGDPPPHVNEAHYLCRLKHYWNPEFAPGDLFLESADTQIVLIWLFGWLTRWLSLSATAWIGRFVAWALIGWAWQRLSWRLIPRPLFSVLSAGLFVILNQQLHFAGEWVIGGVEAKCFAYAFVLFALRDVVDRRWSRAWVFFGIATAFHPLVGGWSGVVCAGIWLLNDRYEVPLRMMLPGLAAGALLSLPGIIPSLLLTLNQPADVVAEANRIYVFDRLPHHLAPLTVAPAEVARRAGGHTLLIALLAALIAITRRQADDRLRRIAQFALGSLMLTAIGLAIELILANEPILAAKLLRYYWFRLADFAVPAASALYLTWLTAQGMQTQRWWGVLLLTASLLFTGWQVAHTAIERYERPIPPADRKIVNLDAWKDVCQWAAENTPSDALFLTPRMNLTFKWRAGRAEVVNRKDLPQDAQSIVEWYQRLQDIYYATIEGETHSLDSLGVLGSDRVRKLALEYGADFILMDRGQLLSLPIAYRNEEYIIYRVD